MLPGVVAADVGRVHGGGGGEGYLKILMKTTLIISVSHLVIVAGGEGTVLNIRPPGD